MQIKSFSSFFLLILLSVLVTSEYFYNSDDYNYCYNENEYHFYNDSTQMMNDYHSEEQMDDPVDKCYQPPIKPGDKKPKTCRQALPKGCDEGKFMLVNASKPIICKRDPKGGKPWQIWLVRQDGSTDFYRDFETYVNGFGNLDGEFFVGLRALEKLTKHRAEVWVHLQDFSNRKYDAYYNNFKVYGRKKKYRLAAVGMYSGTAGDSLDDHTGEPFIARNSKENDCPKKYETALWSLLYRLKDKYGCFKANIFGKYYKPNEGVGIQWNNWEGPKGNLKVLRMGIRRIPEKRHFSTFSSFDEWWAYIRHEADTLTGKRPNIIEM